MFIFIDESGTTNARARQKYFVLSFCLSGNKAFHQDLADEIREKCRKEGKPVLDKKELKYHELSRYQQEIAIGVINRRYKNYYAAFVDIEKADPKMTTGKKEDYIQKMVMKQVALRFRDNMRAQDLTVFVDRKLTDVSMAEIRTYLHELKGSNNGATIEWRNSQTLAGLQIADLIAGAFRAKLMKTSGLLEPKAGHAIECHLKEESAGLGAE